MKNVLLSSSGNKDSLALELRGNLTNLGGGLLVAGDTSATVSTRFVCDDFWRMPPTDEDNFELVVQGLKRHNIGLVIPTRDGELAFWANHKRHLSQLGIQVSVSNIDAISTCLDKVAFCQFAKAHDEAVVPTYTTLEAATFERLVLKERFGSGARQAYIDVSRSEALELEASLVNPIFQPFIEGREVSADSWVSSDQSEVRTSLRFREVVHHGESIVTRTFRDVVVEGIVNRTLRKLANHFGIKGAFTTQLILPPKGPPVLLEINPRIGGASLSSKEIGLDLIQWLLLDEHLPDQIIPPFTRASFDVRVVRSRASIVQHES